MTVSTQLVTPRSPRSGSSVQTMKRPSISEITGKGSGLPNRYVLHAVEGWGKTSFGAQTPKPIFVQTRGETGLETLIDAARLPEVPHFAETLTWDELSSQIDALVEDEHDYRTLVLDTLNGAE